MTNDNDNDDDDDNDNDDDDDNDNDDDHHNNNNTNNNKMTTTCIANCLASTEQRSSNVAVAANKQSAPSAWLYPHTGNTGSHPASCTPSTHSPPKNTATGREVTQRRITTATNALLQATRQEPLSRYRGGVGKWTCIEFWVERAALAPFSPGPVCNDHSDNRARRAYSLAHQARR
ncbi:uncharacterized protein EKO05_0005807 [Ascochyta rabiei]|uniref:Uncharacterized protein n=1 Tax=Didymella rabiei TaxID=5454 RepID=A0A163LLH2_DIDRA|nr:uncharacterized protein EKO05_0005807 [Ascochyta rabiei]KZM27897.1 hypothetical protein ST47_g959 [Ascochyta rabiei]UPX15360.1 hypothetical protein EKO05_0005807 [Ascochyta rabiei]